METARCRAFLQAAEQGSLTAAAEAMGYTPSGVSQLISAWEDELGLKLLERSKKGVSLTGAGERILPAVRRFLAEEQAIYELASEIRGLSVGRVTIASYPSVATYWLPDVIRRFQEDYPNIEIRLMEGIWQEMDAWIRDGVADMGFQTSVDTGDFDWTPLARDRMVAVLPKEHPMAAAEAYPLDRCGEEDFIMPALGHDLDVERLLSQHHIEPRIRFSTMENPVLLSMICSGLGMSVMNELCTTMWSDRLCILPLDPPSTVTFGIAVSKKRHLSPAAVKFREYAVNMLADSSVSVISDEGRRTQKGMPDRK